MLNTQLYDANGLYLMDVMLPSMAPHPDILIYGGRYFVFNQSYQQYREGFALIVPGGAS